MNTEKHFVSSQKCCPSDLTPLVCTALSGYINFVKKYWKQTQYSSELRKVNNSELVEFLTLSRTIFLPYIPACSTWCLVMTFPYRIFFTYFFTLPRIWQFWRHYTLRPIDGKKCQELFKIVSFYHKTATYCLYKFQHVQLIRMYRECCLTG
jgi:hypothetical protein